MRGISPRAGELVRTLQQSASLLERLTRRTLDPGILAELEQIGDVNALPHLVALALSARPESRRGVASVALATWNRVPSASLLELDESYRATWWTPGIDSASWDRLRPADVVALASGGEHAWPLLAVTSFHASGRVRESAVLHLDKSHAGHELPFLIVRLNDWVDVVAERAREAVVRRMDQRWARDWARNLPLVQRLSAAKRRDHREFVEGVHELLRRQPDGEVLEALLASDDQRARRTGFRLAREGRTGASYATIVRRALREHDPFIRFDALRDAAEKFDDATLEPIVEAAVADVFMPIRRHALVVSVERFAERIALRARSALLDSSPAVRELARITMAQRDPAMNIAQFYRDHLTGSSVSALVPAIAGLGETGEASDVGLVAPFATDVRARVRRAAVRALGRLDAVAHASTIISALIDPSAKVVEAACEVFGARPSVIDYETVRSVVMGAPFVHSRIHGLRLARTLGKWANLQLLLEAATSFDPEIDPDVREQVTRWVATANRRFTAPTSQQLTVITELLNHASPSLDMGMRERLKGFLVPWS